MKKSELERFLQRVPQHPSPTPSLEQYMTPAPVAASALFFAAQCGDITSRRVGDLGCGTGILAIGASLLGAAEVVAIDIDRASVEAGREFAEKEALDIDWWNGDIGDFHGELDTVVMNPPFGAQKRHADRPFLQKAFECAQTVHSFHMAATEQFVEREASAAGFTVTHKNKYEISIRHLFDFHRKEKQQIEVILLRMTMGG
jgi:putative methylase